MAHAQIKYVTRAGRDHESITHVGGDTWTWDVAKVIDSINQKTNTFYVQADGKQAAVGVYAKNHLRTHADGKWANNLLSLPPCIVAAA